MQRKEEAEGSVVESRARIEDLKSLLSTKEEALHQAMEKLKIEEKEQESHRLQILTRKAKELKKAKRQVEKVSGARIQTSATILLQVMN